MHDPVLVREFHRTRQNLHDLGGRLRSRGTFAHLALEAAPFDKFE